MDSDSGKAQGSKIDVMAYTIDDKTGALSPAAGTTMARQSNIVAGVAYAANGVNAPWHTTKAGSVSLAEISHRLWIAIGRVLSINAVAAEPTHAAGFAIPSSIDPTGKFAYVLNYAADNVSAYAFDAQTGAFSEVAGSPFAAGPAPYTSTFVTVDPAGKFAYVANLKAVSVYAIDAGSGALSEVSGSPFPVGLGFVDDIPAPDVRVEPRGKFAYVAGQGVDSIWGYALNASTGALSEIPGSPLATGAGSNPNHVTFEPLGRFAYAVHTGGVPSLLAYTINSATGALTPIVGSPFAVPAFTNAPGLEVSFDPTGKFAYVVAYNDPPSYQSSTVAAYRIDVNTGALSEVPGSPFAARIWPLFVAVDPSGKFAYAANRGSDNVSAYTINASTGALTEVAGSPFAAGRFPESIRIDPSGRFAYLANTGSANVSAYAIDANTGALSEVAGSPFPAKGSPINLTIFRTPQ
jgi:6-phosphogluconolactonase (cycloisomerase 2 family)